MLHLLTSSCRMAQPYSWRWFWFVFPCFIENVSNVTDWTSPTPLGSWYPNMSARLSRLRSSSLSSILCRIAKEKCSRIKVESLSYSWTQVAFKANKCSYVVYESVIGSPTPRSLEDPMLSSGAKTFLVWFVSAFWKSPFGRLPFGLGLSKRDACSFPR
jgi:hypothetical protein